ncbi:MAG: alpha-D-ribose 1-methylphosphonate 5-triphosphate diphosphatase [Acidihalobacter sp.]|uniref:alpha-D-ribose 1-methylphosphonate 5-triphosphate diphosphatase n=1 Tax=Acidihalobacter sp. TaxID=1872108 RepID=UPI00307D0F7A
MNTERILTNARIVLPDEVVHGTLLLRDGLIAAVDPGHTSLPAAEDLAGDYVVPGLIELHTDHIETQTFPRPGVRWPTMQALLAHDAAITGAGITTVFDAIAIGHDTGKAYRKDLCGDVLDHLDHAIGAGLLRAEHRVHLRCEVAVPGMTEEFDHYVGRAQVGLVSLMDHTPGQRQFVSMEKYREYYLGKYDITEAELARQIEQRLSIQAEHAQPNRDHVSARCRDTGLPMASHDDATAAHVREAHAEGVRISEFPTTVEAARAAHEHGMATIMGAPNMVRGGSHSGNVSADELAAEGLLDCFSSDYMPRSLLHAAWRLSESDFAPSAALATVTATPARMLGLHDRGAIAPGLRADLVRFTPNVHGPVIRRVWRAGRIVA